MNDEDLLIAIARRLCASEGARRTAGRLLNLGALLLAEQPDVSECELSVRLQAAFLGFDADELGAQRH